MSDTDKLITNYPAAGKEFDIDGMPHVLIPDNCRLQSMESTLKAPARIRAKVQLRELDSFLQYLQQFKAEGSQIFALADTNGLIATCIFDYPNDPEDPLWGDHRCTLTSVFTPEWKRWRDLNTVEFTQAKFAEFVEDNLKLFLAPVGGDMLTIARDIEMKSNVEWKGSVRLENGDTAINFVSTSKAGAGNIELPPQFKVALQPFLGGPRYEVVARLRVRLEEGRLYLRYELLQVDAIIEAAVKETVARIKTETDIAPLAGIAPEKV
jgi:uncharacterized protein YfdQ (DUF2303 family)